MSHPTRAGIWIRRSVLLLFAILVVVLAGTVVRFRQWRAEIIAELPRHSTLAMTAKGPIEFATIGQGPPALALHSSPGGYDITFNVLKLDEARGLSNGLETIIPSRPGYLRTPLTTGATPAEQADAYAALLDTLGKEEVVVIATSGGGPSALQFAIRHPHRCRVLILQSARIRPEPPEEPDGLAEQLIGNTEVGRWLFADLFVDRLQAVDPSDTSIAPIAEAALRAGYPFDQRTVGDDNDQIQFRRMADPRLELLTCPTLIINGAQDANVTMAEAEWAHQRIAGSRLVTVEGDHYIAITRRRQIREATAEFLARHPVGRESHRQSP